MLVLSSRLVFTPDPVGSHITTRNLELFMKKFCFVAGLPRSGSTLLCNILNQNPRFYASGTSPLPHILGATKRSWEKSLDVQSQIDAEKDHYFRRFSNVLRGIIDAWYQEVDAKFLRAKEGGPVPWRP